MNLNRSCFLISQNISADLKGPKVKYKLHYGRCMGLFLGMPHGTTPAAVTTNKNIIMSSFMSSWDDNSILSSFLDKLKLDFWST